MSPFKYRPQWLPDTEVLDWEDNWLSNAMAWASDMVVPDWCKDPAHWTVRWTTYLWAECPCCLAIRFFAVGALFGGAVGLAVGLLI